LILGCAYNSLLISYILGSNAKPLVDSLKELTTNPNVQLVVEKGRGIEISLLVLKNFYDSPNAILIANYFNMFLSDQSAKVGLYKQLGDKLRSQSKSTCETLQECIDLVKTESFAHLNVSYNIVTQSN
jgi:ionotropic glutamate receptor